MQVQRSRLTQVDEVGVGCVAPGTAQFFTVEELVARWFTGTTANTDKTNRDNVRDLISSGVISGRKIGRRWYVHLSVVELYEHGRDDPAVMRHADSRHTASPGVA